MSEGKEFRLVFDGIEISGASSFEGAADFRIDLPRSDHPARLTGTPLGLKVEVRSERWWHWHWYGVAIGHPHWLILERKKQRKLQAMRRAYLRKHAK